MRLSVRPALCLSLALALLSSGCALTSRLPTIGGKTTVQGPGYTTETVRYRCDGATEIDIAYLELGHGESFAALHHQGRTALLRSQPTASGVRYIALDEQHSLRWHSKGDEGSLSFLAADHTAQERTLLANCKAVN